MACPLPSSVSLSLLFPRICHLCAIALSRLLSLSLSLAFCFFLCLRLFIFPKSLFSPLTSHCWRVYIMCLFSNVFFRNDLCFSLLCCVLVDTYVCVCERERVCVHVKRVFVTHNKQMLCRTCFFSCDSSLVLT